MFSGCRFSSCASLYNEKKSRVFCGVLYKLTVFATVNGRFLSEIILTPKT